MFAKLVDPAMLDVSNLNYAGPSTVVFQVFFEGMISQELSLGYLAICIQYCYAGYKHAYICQHSILYVAEGNCDRL